MNDAPTAQTEQQPAPTIEEQPPEYAIVEIMGHRKHAGRIYDVERFGAKMVRIDVPTEGDFAKGYTTHFYSGPSIFSITPTDLATVLKMNKPWEPARLSRWRDEDDPDETTDVGADSEDLADPALDPGGENDPAGDDHL
jgi:hypothetical protein